MNREEATALLSGSKPIHATTFQESAANVHSQSKLKSESASPSLASSCLAHRRSRRLPGKAKSPFSRHFPQCRQHQRRRGLAESDATSKSLSKACHAATQHLSSPIDPC